MIVCFGVASDETFLYSLNAFRNAGIPLRAFDMAQLALSGELTVPIDSLLSSSVQLHGYRQTFGSYTGAFFRPHYIASRAPTEMVGNRAAAQYQLLVRLFGNTDLRVVNPLSNDCSNFSKLYHLVSLAPSLGWQVPRSCLTNSPAQAHSFFDECGGDVIFKGASSAKTWATRYEPSVHEGRLPLLATGPALFQERIDGPDVRVHVVQDRTFAELIESPRLDYRRGGGNTYSPIELPGNIAKGCAQLTTACGIPFLGVDFKIKVATGEWFFLEANSMPCFEGYDRRAKGRISRALIDYLA
jgi:hypothetical protein